MYTTIVALGAALAVMVLLLSKSEHPSAMPVGEENAPIAHGEGDAASVERDDHDELTAQLAEAEASRALGDICTERCNCLCYSRRVDDRIEPITVCRLNQEACTALEKKVQSKSRDSTSGRAVGESVSVSCGPVDLRAINRRNEVSRSEWRPSKRNGGELFGIFYAGQCLLD